MKSVTKCKFSFFLGNAGDMLTELEKLQLARIINDSNQKEKLSSLYRPNLSQTQV